MAEEVNFQRKFLPVPTFWNTVKAFAGAGTFSLPWAIMNAGLWIGSIGLVLISILSNYTMRVLLKCLINAIEEKESMGMPTAQPSYSDLGKKAYGRPGELFICFMNFIVTMSICIAFFILIAENFHGVVDQLSRETIIWIVLPFVLILSLLPDMKYLGYSSIFGAFALMLAMVTIVIYGIKDNSVHPVSDYKFEPENIPLWFGVAAFFFCNHIVVVPISHASGNVRKYPKVLDFAMLFITIINVAFGILCYLYFNFSENGPIPANIIDILPKDDTMAKIVRIGIVLELTCSYPIVVGAGLAVVESSIQFYQKHFTAYPPSPQSKIEYADDSESKASKSNPSEGNLGASPLPTLNKSASDIESADSGVSSVAESHSPLDDIPMPPPKKTFYSKNWKFYLLRLALNCVLAGIATTVKNFGSYMSLIGSLMLAVCGFIIPPLLYFKFFPKQSRTIKIFHSAIVVFGVATTVLGTYISIKTLITG
eukprot:gene5170-6435_t